MSVSLLTAIRTIASNNYNKKNLGLFVLFNIGFMIISFVTAKLFNIYSKQIPFLTLLNLILIIIMTIFFSFYNAGFIAKSSQNAIKLRKGVFPNPFRRIGRTFFIGIKYLFGITIVSILFSLPLLLIIFGEVMGSYYSEISALILTIGVILTILTIIFSITTIKTSELCFLNTLKISSFFKFKENYKKFTDNKKIIFELIGQGFLLCIIVGLIVVIPFIFISIFAPSIVQNPAIKGNLKSIIQCLYGFICSIIFIEMNGQAGRLLFLNKNKVEKEENKQ